MGRLWARLDENTAEIKRAFRNCDDVVMREVRFGRVKRYVGLLRL